MNNFRLEDMMPWLYRLLFISFFLPAKWQTWYLLAFSFAVLAHAIYHKTKLKIFELYMPLLFGSGYLLYILWIAFTPHAIRTELYALLERKVIFFAFPFIALLLSKQTQNCWKPQLIWFVLGTIVTAILGNLMILYHHLFHQPLTNHVSYRVAFEQYTHLHPSYFGMYLCFAISIIWLQGSIYFKNRMWISYLLQGIILLALILLMPKAAVFTFMVLFVYAMFKIFQLKSGYKVAIGICLLFAFGAMYLFFPFVHQRINELLFFTQSNTHDVLNNSVGMRQFILKSDLLLLKEHWFFGLGPSQLQEQLNMIYFVSSLYTQQALGIYNTHNEYLNQWLSFGILGILLFLVVLGIQYRKAIQQKNTLYLFLLIILSITFLTENVLSRQQGVVFYAVCTALFFYEKCSEPVMQNKIK